MSKRFGFIGGGQMAVALASGAIKAGFLEESQLWLAEPNEKQQASLRRLWPKATIVASASQLLGGCEKVVLSVKPQVLKTIASELALTITPSHLLISIAAGISLSQLQCLLGTQRVIRVMPNTPCQVGLGASAISADDSIDESDLRIVEELMGSVGIVSRVPDHLMHAITGVSGSSPAYVYLVIEALSDGGVAMGLSRETATRMAAQAVMGAAKMVLETGLHPGALKDQVTSPGGTTIAALRKLESAGVRSAFMEAVCKCAERSSELE